MGKREKVERESEREGGIGEEREKEWESRGKERRKGRGGKERKSEAGREEEGKGVGARGNRRETHTHRVREILTAKWRNVTEGQRYQQRVNTSKRHI